MDYQQAFNDLFPQFFENEGIRAMPADHFCVELAMPLAGELPPAPECASGYRFDWYRGDPEKLCRAVAQVAEDWVQYFTPENRVLCAFDGEEIASFCIVDDFGQSQGRKIGGPGCVGTVPAYRKQGVGLRLVWEATRLLKEMAYDVSWIHYTHLDRWYGKLGYETVLKWNAGGFLPL